MQLFFFIKQKTTYEMRISDWSSDVCSSDLIGGPEKAYLSASTPTKEIDDGCQGRSSRTIRSRASSRFDAQRAGRHPYLQGDGRRDQIGRASCRERVCPYV